MDKNFHWLLVIFVLLGLLIGQPRPVYADTHGTYLELGQAAGPGTPQPTLVPLAPLFTSTPNTDGSIVHVVGSGQSLWSIAIAYGVKIVDILKNSNLPSTTNVVYIGQKLIIRKGSPATQTPTITATRLTITLTPTSSRIPNTRTPGPTETKTPTITLSATPTLWISSLVPEGTGIGLLLGIGLVSVCVLGLIVVGITGFRKK
jgi:hypothetical protein